MENQETKLVALIQELEGQLLSNEEELMLFAGEGYGIQLEMEMSGNNCECQGNNCQCGDNCACNGNNCRCKGTIIINDSVYVCSL